MGYIRQNHAYQTVRCSVEREKQFECRPVEISRSEIGKQMLHVLYVIIDISCPRKRIKNKGMSCNLLRVPTFMV